MYLVFASDFELEPALLIESSLVIHSRCINFVHVIQEPEELFETVSQALQASVDRDCLSGWGGHVYLV